MVDKAMVNLKDRMRRGRRGCPCRKMLCCLSPIPFKLRAWAGPPHSSPEMTVAYKRLTGQRPS